MAVGSALGTAIAAVAAHFKSHRLPATDDLVLIIMADGVACWPPFSIPLAGCGGWRSTRSAGSRASLEGTAMSYGWWLPAVSTGQLLLLASRLAPEGLLLEIELLHLELLVVEQLLHLFLGQVARLLRLQVDILNHEAVAVVLVDFLDLVKRILWVEDLVLVLVILFFTHVVLFLVTVAWDCQAILLFSILIVYKLILMLLDDVAVGCHVLFVIDVLLATLDVDLSDL